MAPSATVPAGRPRSGIHRRRSGPRSARRGLHHSLGDGQAQPGSAIIPTARRRPAPTGVEDPGQALLRDAAASVDDGDLHSVRPRPAGRAPERSFPDRCAGWHWPRGWPTHGPGRPERRGRPAGRRSGTSRSSRTRPEAAVAAASEATSVISSVSDTSWDTFGRRRALDAGQREEVVDQDGHPGHRAAEVGQGPRDVARSRRPPVPPRGRASRPTGSADRGT